MLIMILGIFIILDEDYKKNIQKIGLVTLLTLTYNLRYTNKHERFNKNSNFWVFGVGFWKFY